jgi:hypothetical protein
MIAKTKNISIGLQSVELAKDNRDKLYQSENIKGMDEGRDHEKASSSGMHFLYEGDGYAVIGNFDLARSMYESQIMLLRSKADLDIKALAMCHGRLGNIRYIIIMISIYLDVCFTIF